MGSGGIKGKPCGYTPSLDMLIVSICGDYARRERALAAGLVSTRTGMEYRYLDYRIYEAACEIAGERYAELYIKEIGDKVGYANSRHDAISETAYKIEKQEVKVNIAKKLHLLD